MIRFWRLNERTVDNLGLACTEEGLFLGRTPLIERRGKRFVVRERIEVERLLKRAYQTEPAVHRLMPGLATVAAALNADDQCLARIAAVHLQIPDLPSEAARDSVEAEDVLIKLADWNPALHPRIGAPPNPGWFASTDGVSEDELPLRIAQNEDKSRATDLAPIAADTPVRLPPGDRIDELGDFLEWLANANGWAARGRYFDELYRDGSLHPLSRTIDNFDASGVATSIKSLDLNAITYKDFSRLTSRLNNYIGKLEEYAGSNWGGDQVDASAITGRALRLIVPEGSMTPLQRKAFEAAHARAKHSGIDLIVTEF